MLSRFGPSGLLRLVAMLGIGASLLLAGCATSAPETATQTAGAEKEGWTRCDHPRAGGITLVCWKR